MRWIDLGLLKMKQPRYTLLLARGYKGWIVCGNRKFATIRYKVKEGSDFTSHETFVFTSTSLLPTI